MFLSSCVSGLAGIGFVSWILLDLVELIFVIAVCIWP
jgi:hypothetical protein